MRRVVENHKVLLSDKIAQNAAILLSPGAALSQVSNDPAPRSAALLNFYQVLEEVSKATKPDVPANYDQVQEHIIQSLLDKLVKLEWTKKKASAARSAVIDLAKLDAVYADLRRESTAQKLGMSEDWKMMAAELHKFRNTKLGHSGATADPEQLQAWFEPGYPKAYIVAQDFLNALIVYRLKQATPAAMHRPGRDNATELY